MRLFVTAFTMQSVHIEQIFQSKHKTWQEAVGTLAIHQMDRTDTTGLPPGTLHLDLTKGLMSHTLCAQPSNDG